MRLEYRGTLAGERHWFVMAGPEPLKERTAACEEIAQWCHEHFGEQFPDGVNQLVWVLHEIHFQITDPNHAVELRLRWC